MSTRPMPFRLLVLLVSTHRENCRTFLTLMMASWRIHNITTFHVKKQGLSRIRGPVAWLQSDPAGGVYPMNVERSPRISEMYLQKILNVLSSAQVGSEPGWRADFPRAISVTPDARDCRSSIVATFAWKAITCARRTCPDWLWRYVVVLRWCS